MRITVFGATGMAGSAIVTEALSRGHEVTALSRRPMETLGQERLTAFAVDITGPLDIGPLLIDVDVAVLTVRLPPGEESEIAPVTRRVLDAAARHGVRVFVVGGSAPLRSPTSPDRLVVDDPAYVPEAWKTIAEASLDQFHVCERHAEAQWTYLSPPAVLEPRARTGRYRRGRTTLLVDADGDSRIAVPDLATALVDEIEHPNGERHFTVAGAPDAR
ncbi:NAD(P)-dependent oxidoreductase [Aeromicrobium piscarium]|uniref:NAD-dependent epimerase/dehydratase family protein n=1 Tax=Aeromicrobium piscarium TaxID=2590901 RepID=A0A554S8W1_9ACTN|nr:NAD(P)H-binding protein [Aeromicrobium piscarium]TSD62788.1 NAD-dependent epimerase/dehydratase family protein [Aeromicrobium piscarium]